MKKPNKFMGFKVSNIKRADALFVSRIKAAKKMLSESDIGPHMCLLFLKK